MAIMLHLPLDTPRPAALETEYGVHPQPETITQQQVADAAPQLHVMVSGQSGRGLCASAARLYPDQAKNIEYAGPIQYTTLGMLGAHFAGQRIVENVVDVIYDGKRSAYKRTADSGGKTRSDHENYLTGVGEDPKEIAPMLLPHLVSRIVLTGSGMVLINPSGKSWSYVLSQRAHDLGSNICSSSSTTDRSKPFIIDRDEHFNDKKFTRRLQIGSGEANMFAFPIAMRLLSTSLILRLIEQGEYPEGLQFHDDQNPFEAIYKISRDPNMRTKVHMKNNRSYTGPELSFELATAVNKFVEAHDELPESEKVFAPVWLQAASDVMDGNFDRWQRHIEHFAKHEWLIKKQSGANHKERTARTAQRDIHWHRIGPKSIISQFVEKNLVAMMPSNKVIEDAIEEPLDPTRALRQSRAFKKYVQIYPEKVNWHKWYENGKLVTVNDPFRYW